MNPLGNAPIFLAMTMDCTESSRTVLARQVATNSLILLLGSLFVGSHVLNFFGITIPILRIAGGVVVSSIGWKLLHATGSYIDQHSAQSGTPTTKERSFYPLTLPLTIGPGSISVAITLGRPPPGDRCRLCALRPARLRRRGRRSGHRPDHLPVLTALRKRSSTCWGRTGINVFLRLSAFILFCIGIEIAWSGYSQLACLPR